MLTQNSHPLSPVCRGFEKASLLMGSSSSNSTMKNVKVVRLDIDELTDGDVQSRNTLTRLLDRITSGSDEVFTSPITNNATPEEILSGWDEIFEVNKSKINSVLENIEMSNRSKYGPRSIAKPWSERKEKLYSSFGKEGNKELLVPNLGITRRLRPLTMHEAAKYLKASTNSGLPYLMRKRNVVDEVLSSDIEYNFGKYPAVLFTRTQEGGKTRDVWGYPIFDTLFEMAYYRPLLSHQIKQPWRAALRTPESLDIAINKLMSNNKIAGNYLFSGDISEFDDDAKFYSQLTAFRSIGDCYQEQYQDNIKRIFFNFNTIPIVTPDGVLTGPHGVPSGSTFTNEVGSTIQYSVYSSCDCAALDTIQIQGDDSVCSTSNPDKVFQSFIDAGFKINESKSDVSDKYCTYLQFLYHPDYLTSNSIIGGVYSTYRALNRIVYMERFDDISSDGISGKDYFAIRTISILENCKHHPLFKYLVKYIWSLDKYKLKTSDLGIRQFVSRKRMQEGKDIRFSNYTYGDDIEGIKNFETYKLLRELNV